MPGSTGLGPVASPEALSLPGGLEDVAAGCGDQLGSGRGDGAPQASLSPWDSAGRRWHG